jgi:ribonucleoside-diphosphate reductase beta chain
MSYKDKRLIKGTGVYHLAPFKYEWAWRDMKNGRDNDWRPEEIPMGSDKACFESKLNSAEQEMFINIFATLTTSDVVVGRNVAVSTYQHITAPEVCAYLARQIEEERLHSYSYQHILEVLGLDQDEVYSRYERIPEISKKFKIAEFWSEKIHQGPTSAFSLRPLEHFILGLMFYYAVFEGIWFYNGFSPIFSLQRRNLMTGTGEQLQYIMRDEAMHVAFGIRLVRELMKEEGVAVPTQAVHSMFEEALNAEFAYADRILPNILGYNSALHKGQAMYLANRRLKQLGYAPLYETAPITLTWLDEQVNIKKEKNFFETRVTEYRSAASLEGTWDE